MTAQIPHDERRTYVRVPAYVNVRPVSLLVRSVPQRVTDVSLGGLRCYSDEPHRAGERLELELSFVDGRCATVLAEVVWVERLPAGAPATYDVGMRYLDCSPEGLDLIREALRSQPG